MRLSVVAFLWCALFVSGPASVAFGAEKDTAKSVAPPLAFIAVVGAPGDGEQSLTVALTKRLSAVGVKPGSAQATNVYSVEGVVRVTPSKGGKQSARIDWTIFAPDGNTLGGVSQTKIVRKGSLDRKWGAAAEAAARSAANEIAKLLPH